MSSVAGIDRDLVFLQGTGPFPLSYVAIANLGNFRIVYIGGVYGYRNRQNKKISAIGPCLAENVVALGKRRL